MLPLDVSMDFLSHFFWCIARCWLIFSVSPITSIRSSKELINNSSLDVPAFGYDMDERLLLRLGFIGGLHYRGLSILNYYCYRFFVNLFRFVVADLLDSIV